MEITSSFDEFINKNPHIGFISELNKSIKKMGLTMVYEGVVEQTIIRTIANSIEKKMEEENENIKLKKLIFHITVELLQNIAKYSDDEIKGKGIIIVGKVHEKYYISSGNVIKNEKVSILTSLIESINQLNTDEIKNLYETAISNGKYNTQGGAGLGLIDIVRKSKEKLQYNFESLNNNTAFFLVTITILK